MADEYTFHCLRVDAPLEAALEVVKQSIDASAPYADCIEEPDGKNLHMHFLIVLECKADTFRQRLRKAGYSGNGKYSLSVCRDPLKALAYIMKEPRHVTLRWDDEFVEAARNHDEKVKTEMKKKKGCFETLKQKIPQYTEFYNTRPRSSRESELEHMIMADILQYHVDNSLMIRMFQVKSCFDTLVLNVRGVQSMLKYYILKMT